MKSTSITLVQLGVALCLGIFLTFAFAPYDIFPLAVLCPAGLFYLWTKTEQRWQAFFLGYSFGLGLFGAGVYWVFISIHEFGGVGTPLAFFITSAMIAYLALYPAIVGYIARRFFKKPIIANTVYVMPALWVISEWLRAWIITGFPWLFLGYSQVLSPLKGYAPLLSVYGVSLAVAMSSALLVSAFSQYQIKNYKKLYYQLFAFIFIWFAGALLSLIPWTKPIGQPISFSLVQGNIPQSIKWTKEYLQTSFIRYQELTQPLWKKSQLIIWPEGAIPVPLQFVPDFINGMDALARQHHSQLIFGIPITAYEKHYYNAVVAVGQERQAYLKRHLVPFGEFTPFENYFSHFLHVMDIPMSNDVAGKYTQDPLHLQNIVINTSICYEIGFPELIRSREAAPGILLTVTDDAWFGHSNAQAQHLEMGQMRAIELGRPALFVSNDGITALIGADGSVIEQAPPYQVYVLSGKVQAMQGVTPWMHNGMDPILFIIICLLAAAIFQQSRKSITLNQRVENGTTI